MRACLTGGEVFTRPDIFEIVDGVIDAGMRYSILTNGTLVDSGTIEAFRAGRRRLRLDSIQVSLDGHEASVHDAMRPDSFDRAIAKFAALYADQNERDYDASKLAAKDGRIEVETEVS